RLLCVLWQGASIHRDGPDLVFTYRNEPKARQVAALSDGRVKGVDGEGAYLRLKPGEEDPEAEDRFVLAVLKPAQSVVAPARARPRGVGAKHDVAPLGRFGIRTWLNRTGTLRR